MRVEHAERMLRRCDVVAQDEVQLIVYAAAAGNGRDGVVRLAVRLGKDEGALVRVAAPCAQDTVGQLHKAVAVRAGQAQNGHRPLDDARADIVKAAEADRLLDRRALHGKCVVPALEMVVAQDGAADDGQVGIRADKVVRELADEVQQLAEGRAVDLHRRMRAVEDDAVLVIIDIRRILQIPAAAVDRHGNDTVILAGRVVHPSGIALVFGAESALGIAGLRRELGRRNGARVLLRLGEVDRDVQRTVGALVDPLLIARDAVAADIIRVLAEGVEPVRRPLR